MFVGPAEALCRVHYLVSIAATNVGMLVLLFGPFERNAHVAWLSLCGLPYIFVYSRDLVRCGYRWSDFLRVCVLNLLLIPIHLGGVLKSLHQAATGLRTPFGRTPKVTGRTAAPAGYVLAEYGLLLGSVAMLVMNTYAGHWISAAFALVYSVACAYAIVQFIGLRESARDLLLWLRPSPPQPEAEVPIPRSARGELSLVPRHALNVHADFAESAALRGRGEGRALHAGADD